MNLDSSSYTSLLDYFPANSSSNAHPYISNHPSSHSTTSLVESANAANSMYLPVNQRYYYDGYDKQMYVNDVAPAVHGYYSGATPSGLYSSSPSLMANSNEHYLNSQQLGQSHSQPIYVNPKQYHRIMKRRQSKAIVESQIQIKKQKRPYIHESRHRHAMKRPRGPSGRFLTAKELEALKNASSETEAAEN